jgi:hypothetical protein
MKGMVDSFNVSVAAGILMHHAVCDRVSRLVSTFFFPFVMSFHLDRKLDTFVKSFSHLLTRKHL